MLAAALSGRLNIGGCAWDAQLFPSSIMVALLSVLPEQSLLQHTISTEKFPISKKRRRSSLNFLPNTLRYPFAALPLSRQDHAPLYKQKVKLLVVLPYFPDTYRILHKLRQTLFLSMRILNSSTKKMSIAKPAMPILFYCIICPDARCRGRIPQSYGHWRKILPLQC